jgi:hypothetical protein
VLISPPRDLRAPFRLGWTPPGLTLTYISSVDNAGLGLDDELVGRLKADCLTLY